MNAIEKAIATFSPSRAVKRAEDRIKLNALGAYEGSNTSPRTRNPRGTHRAIPARYGEDKALPSGDRASLITEIEDLMRNDGGLIKTIVTRTADHVVGDGIMPQARTSDPEWNEQAEDYFVRFWSPSADFESRQNFPFLGTGQRLLINEAFVRGESFIKLLSSGSQVQWYESQMCQTPFDKVSDGRAVDGVALTNAGSVRGYYFTIPRDGEKDAQDFVLRNNIIHGIPEYLRSRQRRGVPILAPIVPRMQQFAATTDAMQVKVLLESMQALAVTGMGQGGRTIQDMPYGAAKSDENDRAYDQIKTEYGMIYDLPEGRQLAAVETRTPSNEHMAYMDHHLQLLAGACGIPRDILLMIAGGSYSAHRGLLLEFERTRMRYWNYVTGISQRLWNWSIAKAIKEGRLPPAPVQRVNGFVRSEWDRVEWTKPMRLSMSPKEDEAVRDMKLARGDYTITDFMKQDNRERSDVWQVAQEEITDAIERANAINEAHPGADVTWRDFVNKQRAGAAPPPQPTGGNLDA